MREFQRPLSVPLVCSFLRLFSALSISSSKLWRTLLRKRYRSFLAAAHVSWKTFTHYFHCLLPLLEWPPLLLLLLTTPLTLLPPLWSSLPTYRCTVGWIPGVLVCCVELLCDGCPVTCKSKGKVRNDSHYYDADITRRFMIYDSISLVIIGLFRFSIS